MIVTVHLDLGQHAQYTLKKNVSKVYFKSTVSVMIGSIEPYSFLVTKKATHTMKHTFALAQSSAISLE